ncbi:hypothetical protein [Halalkalibacter alkalisediminis]|uniref:Uncharacterized protein n=1 Tax=Halalkalibacter alkalisediminis TaxID=935616 RepID=A0ABV6NCG5_9BACI|nr:hypothetical protein [Halalkalibacter alkalisediminis]
MKKLKLILILVTMTLSLSFIYPDLTNTLEDFQTNELPFHH